MGTETRHMHLYVFCRVHPNDQELAPLGPSRGVYNTFEEVEDALDELVEASQRQGIAADDLIEFRVPGMMGIQTTTASDTRSIEFGGDGRCHRVFVQVWCIGDPAECAAMIQVNTRGKMLHMLPEMMTSDDPDVRDIATKGMIMMLKDMMGGLELDENEDEDDIMRLPDLPPQRDFGISYANEPLDDFLDFGGFDEPKGPKRLN